MNEVNPALSGTKLLLTKRILILLRVPPLKIYNQNTVGKNGYFQAIRVKVSCKR